MKTKDRHSIRITPEMHRKTVKISCQLIRLVLKKSKIKPVPASHICFFWKEVAAVLFAQASSLC